MRADERDAIGSGDVVPGDVHGLLEIDVVGHRFADAGGAGGDLAEERVTRTAISQTSTTSTFGYQYIRQFFPGQWT